MYRFRLTVLFIVFAVSATAQRHMHTDVLVIGGGAGGTAAGIQSARMGVATAIAEPTAWLGGMLSAAGIAAVDGNHDLPAGIWGECRDSIYKVYGGSANVETGWVSNTCFEPHVADSIFKQMCSNEKKLTVLYQWFFKKVLQKKQRITGAIFTNNKNETLVIEAKVVIDATELGDVIADAKIPFDIGMEPDTLFGEVIGAKEKNNILQDLTYGAILKDYGSAADCSIAKPQGYSPQEFDGACTNYYVNQQLTAPTVDAEKMLSYARLPNNKYLLNWPNQGNDIYLNVIGLKEQQKNRLLQKAKQKTLRFVYFIQHQLGYKHFGLAKDEFPTADHLPLIPYHREGRRMKGLVQLKLENIASPFNASFPLYRTGIAVGDYPIDHHHKKNSSIKKQFVFPPIPSYNIPLGALIPQFADGLIAAEKSISVTNVVNGTTRLQPVVLLTGQAAGALAALSVIENKPPRFVAVRKVQNALLKSGAYLMPYMDVRVNEAGFIAIQKIGATGILKGVGIPYQWSNQTWFYPDSNVSANSFIKDCNAFAKLSFSTTNSFISIQDLLTVVEQYQQQFKIVNNYSYTNVAQNWTAAGLHDFNLQRLVKRVEAAILLDYWIHPFEQKQINYQGNFIEE